MVRTLEEIAAVPMRDWDDDDRISFTRWLHRRPRSWRCDAWSCYACAIAKWFNSQGFALASVFGESVWINYGLIDEEIIRLDEWALAFLDACHSTSWVHPTTGRHSTAILSREVVLACVEQADWAVGDTTPTAA